MRRSCRIGIGPSSLASWTRAMRTRFSRIALCPRVFVQFDLAMHIAGSRSRTTATPRFRDLVRVCCCVAFAALLTTGRSFSSAPRPAPSLAFLPGFAGVLRELAGTACCSRLESSAPRGARSNGVVTDNDLASGSVLDLIVDINRSTSGADGTRFTGSCQVGCLSTAVAPSTAQSRLASAH